MKAAARGGALGLAAVMLPAGAQAEDYTVKITKIMAVLPSKGDIAGLKAAIADQVPGVGYLNTKVDEFVGVTPQKISGLLDDLRNKQAAAGKPLTLADVVSEFHLGKRKTLEQEVKSRFANMVQGDAITNLAYGGNRPPDNVYLSYAGPERRAKCSLPLHECGANYIAMSEGQIVDVSGRPESAGITDRALNYHLWDQNPWPVPDKLLGTWKMDPAADLGKGYNVASILGDQSIGSPLYLVEYVVVRKGDPVPPAPPMPAVAR